MEKHFKSSFDRIVGGSDEKKAEAAYKLSRAAQERDPRESYADFEITKSQEAIRLIEFTQEAVGEIARSFGANSKPIPLDKIRLLRNRTTYEATGRQHYSAHYHVMTAEVVIGKRESKLGFALSLAHELFHHSSYKSAQITPHDITAFRSGLHVFPNKLRGAAHHKEGAFKDFEEALVVESVKMFFEQSASKDPQFEKEISTTEKVKELYVKACEDKGIMDNERRHLIDDVVAITDASDLLIEYKKRKNDDTFLINEVESLGKQGLIEEFGRREERSILHAFINAVCDKSNGTYSHDQLLQMFFHANFSGKLLSLVRTIDGVLGKGEFRRIDSEVRARMKNIHASWSEDASLGDHKI